MEVTQCTNIKCILHLVWISISIVIVSAESNYCIDYGYTPGNGTRTPVAQSGFMYFEHAVIRYSCNKNFELKPHNPEQVCTMIDSQKYLQWIPSYPPSCVKFESCPTPVILHGTPTRNSYHYGDVLHIDCDDGFEVKTQTNQSVCLKTGKWSSVPSCTEKGCADPFPIDNGYYQVEDFSILFNDSWPPGTSIFYTCDDGYYLHPLEQTRRFCYKGRWNGDDPQCVLNSCDPPDDVAYGSYRPRKDRYNVGDSVSYLCYLSGSIVRRCLGHNEWGQSEWSGSWGPCSTAVSTEPMPYTTNGHVYCMTPMTINHGTVLCCSDTEVTKNFTEDPKYCCPVNGVVRFVCDVGYVIEEEATQWKCGAHGQWIFIDAPEHGQPSSSPVCYSNTTRPEESALPDDMLKPVLGTAAGVLFILSAAIIIAFCRPKLKDIKRRWREQREDEDELIIDGRRILLPSYEEAVSAPHDPNYLQLAQPCTSRCHDSMPGPSYTNMCLDENREQDATPCPRSSSRDDVSLILQIHPEPPPSRKPRKSSSSDEEMLIPGSARRSRTLDNVVTNSEPPHEPPQAKGAGEETSTSIVINRPPAFALEAGFSEQNSLNHDKNFVDFTPSPNATTPLEMPTVVDVQCSDSCSENKNNFTHFNNAADLCAEHDAAFSIQPRGMVRPDSMVQQPDPIMSQEVHALLTYPLALTESEYDGSGVVQEQNLTFTINLGDDDNTELTKQQPDPLDNCDPDGADDGEPEDAEVQVIDAPSQVRSNNVCLVTSSNSADDQQFNDLTGSTTV